MEVAALRAKITKLKDEVCSLKSTYISRIFGMVEIEEIPGMPQSTYREDKAVDQESEVDTDELK